MKAPAAPRPFLGALAAVAAFSLAVGLALTPRPGLALLIGVEQIASAAEGLLSRLAVALPLGYAFGAGMVSAVNPCGFALLPAYLGLYLGQGDESAHSVAGRLIRALAVSATVTASFVLLFGVVGLALGVTKLALGPFLAWVGAAVGLLLVVAGGVLLAGGHLGASFAQRLGSRLGGTASRGGIRGYAAYGLAYGASSLGCTLPIFLTVVGGALTAGGATAVVAQLVLYALGMGFVLGILTVAAALVKQAAFGVPRRLGAFVEPAGAILLLVTGGYVVYYWLSVGVLVR